MNTFRVILNAYSHEDIPLIEDRSYFWEHLGRQLYPVPRAILDAKPPLERNAGEHFAAHLDDAAK